MREIRTSGATSGDWKRSYGVGLRHRHRRKRPLPTVAATAPVVDSTFAMRDGSAVSWMRSNPTFASHCLNGSAFFEGMDWMMRNSVSMLAQSVMRIFPSGAGNLNP
jgi:hypothetical protein